MKLRELDALPGDRIDVGRLKLVVSVDRQIAIALIIRDDQDDVRATRLGAQNRRSAGSGQEITSRQRHGESVLQRAIC